MVAVRPEIRRKFLPFPFSIHGKPRQYSIAGKTRQYLLPEQKEMPGKNARQELVENPLRGFPPVFCSLLRAEFVRLWHTNSTLAA